MRGLIPFNAVLLVAGTSVPAWAHAGAAHAGASWLPAEPWVLVTLAITAGLYAIGFRRLRHRSGHRIATKAAMAAFAAAVLVSLAVLAEPADRLSAQLFSAHMVQHLVLMLAVAPLLVWGRTAMVLFWALPRGSRKGLGRWWAAGSGRFLRPWLTHPLAIWVWFCGFFVFWHIPGPYEWALRNEAVHILEHLFFLATSYGFWSVVIEPLGRRRLGYGASLLYVAVAAVISSLPGALMILADRPLYARHRLGVAEWGLTLVEDQQLGGLIMWIPGGFTYLAAICILFLLWMREAERRNLRRLAPAAAVGALAVLGGCEDSGMASRFPDIGDPEKGAVLIQEIGCGSCHQIPGIDEADGLVGPPLDHMGQRIFIAGLLRNTPANLMTWIRNPQDIVPGNAMPDMGITEEQAQDIAAYLYTLD